MDVFSRPLQIIDLNNIVKCEKLYSSINYEVYIGINKKENQKIRIIEYNVEITEEKDIENHIMYIEKYNLIHSPLISNYTGYFYSEEDRFLTLTGEYINKKSLYDLFNDSNFFAKVTIHEKFRYIFGIISGLYALHKNDFVHRNLNPLNIIINAKNETILSDIYIFEVDPKARYDFGVHKMIAYESPELKYYRKFSDRSDIFSFGVIAYYILNGELPSFDFASDNKSKFRSEYSEEIKSIILRCFDEDQSLRPSAHEIIEVLTDSTFVPRDVNTNNLKDFYLSNFPSIPDLDKYDHSSVDINNVSDLYNLAVSFFNSNEFNNAFALFKRAADMGHKYSMFCFAYMAEVIYDKIDIAVPYYRGSAELGEVNAQFRYALYLMNIHVDIDNIKNQLESAADSGHSDAACLLGRIYEQKGDLESAIKYYKISAQGRNSDALYSLSVLLGRFKDESIRRQSIDYLRMAVDRRNLSAMLDVVNKQEFHDLFPHEFRIHCTKMAAERGDLCCQLKYANILKERKDDSYLLYTELAASQNDFDSMKEFAYAALQGIKIKKDEVKAAKFLEKLADKDIDSAVTLAKIIQKDKRFAQSVQRAKTLINTAYEKGSTEAFYILGNAYITGSLGEYDLQKGAKILEQASNSGHKQACFELGLLYGAGIEIVIREAKCHELLRKSENPQAEELIHHGKNALIQTLSDLGCPSAQILIGRMLVSEGNFEKGAQLLHNPSTFFSNIKEEYKFLIEEMTLLKEIEKEHNIRDNIKLKTRLKDILSIKRNRNIIGKAEIDILNRISSEMDDIISQIQKEDQEKFIYTIRMYSRLNELKNKKLKDDELDELHDIRSRLETERQSLVQSYKERNENLTNEEVENMMLLEKIEKELSEEKSSINWSKKELNKSIEEQIEAMNLIGENNMNLHVHHVDTKERIFVTPKLTKNVTQSRSPIVYHGEPYICDYPPQSNITNRTASSVRSKFGCSTNVLVTDNNFVSIVYSLMSRVGFSGDKNVDKIVFDLVYTCLINSITESSIIYQDFNNSDIDFFIESFVNDIIYWALHDSVLKVTNEKSGDTFVLGRRSGDLTSSIISSLNENLRMQCYPQRCLYSNVAGFFDLGSDMTESTLNSDEEYINYISKLTIGFVINDCILHLSTSFFVNESQGVPCLEPSTFHSGSESRSLEDSNSLYDSYGGMIIGTASRNSFTNGTPSHKLSCPNSGENCFIGHEETLYKATDDSLCANMDLLHKYEHFNGEYNGVSSLSNSDSPSISNIVTFFSDLEKSDHTESVLKDDNEAILFASDSQINICRESELLSTELRSFGNEIEHIDPDVSDDRSPGEKQLNYRNFDDTSLGFLDTIMKGSMEIELDNNQENSSSGRRQNNSSSEMLSMSVGHQKLHNIKVQDNSGIANTPEGKVSNSNRSSGKRGQRKSGEQSEGHLSSKDDKSLSHEFEDLNVDEDNISDPNKSQGERERRKPTEQSDEYALDQISFDNLENIYLKKGSLSTSPTLRCGTDTVNNVTLPLIESSSSLDCFCDLEHVNFFSMTDTHPPKDNNNDTETCEYMSEFRKATKISNSDVIRSSPALHDGVILQESQKTDTAVSSSNSGVSEFRNTELISQLQSVHQDDLNSLDISSISTRKRLYSHSIASDYIEHSHPFDLTDDMILTYSHDGKYIVDLSESNSVPLESASQYQRDSFTLDSVSPIPNRTDVLVTENHSPAPISPCSSLPIPNNADNILLEPRSKDHRKEKQTNYILNRDGLETQCTAKDVIALSEQKGELDTSLNSTDQDIMNIGKDVDSHVIHDGQYAAVDNSNPGGNELLPENLSIQDGSLSTRDHYSNDVRLIQDYGNISPENYNIKCNIDQVICQSSDTIMNDSNISYEFNNLVDGKDYASNDSTTGENTDSKYHTIDYKSTNNYIHAQNQNDNINYFNRCDTVSDGILSNSEFDLSCKDHHRHVTTEHELLEKDCNLITTSKSNKSAVSSSRVVSSFQQNQQHDKGENASYSPVQTVDDDIITSDSLLNDVDDLFDNDLHNTDTTNSYRDSKLHKLQQSPNTSNDEVFHNNINDLNSSQCPINPFNGSDCLQRDHTTLLDSDLCMSHGTNTNDTQDQELKLNSDHTQKNSHRHNEIKKEANKTNQLAASDTQKVPCRHSQPPGDPVTSSGTMRGSSMNLNRKSVSLELMYQNLTDNIDKVVNDIEKIKNRISSPISPISSNHVDDNTRISPVEDHNLTNENTAHADAYRFREYKNIDQNVSNSDNKISKNTSLSPNEPITEISDKNVSQMETSNRSILVNKAVNHCITNSIHEETINKRTVGTNCINDNPEASNDFNSSDINTSDNLTSHMRLLLVKLDSELQQSLMENRFIIEYHDPKIAINALENIRYGIKTHISQFRPIYENLMKMFSDIITDNVSDSDVSDEIIDIYKSLSNIQKMEELLLNKERAALNAVKGMNIPDFDMELTRPIFPDSNEIVNQMLEGSKKDNDKEHDKLLKNIRQAIDKYNSGLNTALHTNKNILHNPEQNKSVNDDESSSLHHTDLLEKGISIKSDNAKHKQSSKSALLLTNKSKKSDKKLISSLAPAHRNNQSQQGSSAIDLSSDNSNIEGSLQSDSDTSSSFSIEVSKSDGDKIKQRIKKEVEKRVNAAMIKVDKRLNSKIKKVTQKLLPNLEKGDTSEDLIRGDIESAIRHEEEVKFGKDVKRMLCSEIGNELKLTEDGRTQTDSVQQAFDQEIIVNNQREHESITNLNIFRCKEVERRIIEEVEVSVRILDEAVTRAEEEIREMTEREAEQKFEEEACLALEEFVISAEAEKEVAEEIKQKMIESEGKIRKENELLLQYEVYQKNVIEERLKAFEDEIAARDFTEDRINVFSEYSLRNSVDSIVNIEIESGTKDKEIEIFKTGLNPRQTQTECLLWQKSHFEDNHANNDTKFDTSKFCDGQNAYGVMNHLSLSLMNENLASLSSRHDVQKDIYIHPEQKISSGNNNIHYYSEYYHHSIPDEQNMKKENQTSILRSRKSSVTDGGKDIYNHQGDESIKGNENDTKCDASYIGQSKCEGCISENTSQDRNINVVSELNHIIHKPRHSSTESHSSGKDSGGSHGHRFRHETHGVSCLQYLNNEMVEKQVEEDNILNTQHCMSQDGTTEQTDNDLAAVSWNQHVRFEENNDSVLISTENPANSSTIHDNFNVHINSPVSDTRSIDENEASNVKPQQRLGSNDNDKIYYHNSKQSISKQVQGIMRQPTSNDSSKTGESQFHGLTDAKEDYVESELGSNKKKDVKEEEHVESETDNKRLILSDDKHHLIVNTESNVVDNALQSKHLDLATSSPTCNAKTLVSTSSNFSENHDHFPRVSSTYPPQSVPTTDQGLSGSDVSVDEKFPGMSKSSTLQHESPVSEEHSQNTEHANSIKIDGSHEFTNSMSESVVSTSTSKELYHSKEGDDDKCTTQKDNQCEKKQESSELYSHDKRNNTTNFMHVETVADNADVYTNTVDTGNQDKSQEGIRSLGNENKSFGSPFSARNSNMPPLTEEKIFEAPNQNNSYDRTFAIRKSGEMRNSSTLNICDKHCSIVPDDPNVIPSCVSSISESNKGLAQGKSNFLPNLQDQVTTVTKSNISNQKASVMVNSTMNEEKHPTNPFESPKDNLSSKTGEKSYELMGKGCDGQSLRPQTNPSNGDCKEFRACDRKDLSKDSSSAPSILPEVPEPSVHPYISIAIGNKPCSNRTNSNEVRNSHADNLSTHEEPCKMTLQPTNANIENNMHETSDVDLYEHQKATHLEESLPGIPLKGCLREQSIEVDDKQKSIVGHLPDCIDVDRVTKQSFEKNVSLPEYENCNTKELHKERARETLIQKKEEQLQREEKNRILVEKRRKKAQKDLVLRAKLMEKSNQEKIDKEKSRLDRARNKLDVMFSNPKDRDVSPKKESLVEKEQRLEYEIKKRAGRLGKGRVKGAPPSSSTGHAADSHISPTSPVTSREGPSKELGEQIKKNEEKGLLLALQYNREKPKVNLKANRTDSKDILKEVFKNYGILENEESSSSMGNHNILKRNLNINDNRFCQAHNSQPTSHRNAKVQNHQGISDIKQASNHTDAKKVTTDRKDNTNDQGSNPIAHKLSGNGAGLMPLGKLSVVSGVGSHYKVSEDPEVYRYSSVPPTMDNRQSIPKHSTGRPNPIFSSQVVDLEFDIIPPDATERVKSKVRELDYENIRLTKQAEKVPENLQNSNETSDSQQITLDNSEIYECSIDRSQLEDISNIKCSRKDYSGISDSLKNLSDLSDNEKSITDLFKEISCLSALQGNPNKNGKILKH